ncbi:MAG TPA: carboxypeptidase-like regulatory domain-containing protein [Terriglobales bacterium]|nr:carboxypeptidase-like regulatory domain-containing protein [Terriglobales bacterium]
MIKLATSAAMAVLLSLALSAKAQTLSGTVTNATTNKPAAGDAIELINISNGMDVAATAKADSAGKFSFSIKDGAQGPHLVRATHQGVTYFQFAPPGTSNVDLKVYDVAKKVDGLSLTADVFRLQADSGTLQGMRLFAVDNNSSTTQMNDHNFEFYLPAGAKVEQLQARAPNGQPISAEAVPEKEPGRYAVAFPLRPGETQFQLEFTMPYSGSLKIDPKPLYPAEHFVVVLPKSMKFAPAGGVTEFKSMNDPNSPDSVVQVAQQTKVGQALGFSISGTGTISDQPAQASGGGGPMNENPQTESNRPGGGLGAPIDAPDPLDKYRWPIIGAFIVLLAAGGWIVTKRQGAVSAASGGGSRATLASGPLVAPITGPGAAAITGAGKTPPGHGQAIAAGANTASSKSSMLLEGLKEELFQLEVERKQGKISSADYEKAKAALDQTLERALKRQG